MAVASMSFETGLPRADLARLTDNRFLDVDHSPPTVRGHRALKLSRSVANIALMANRGISPVRGIAKKAQITPASTPISTPLSTPVLTSKKGHHR